MEKYLALVLLVTPGFIAKKVAKCLGDKQSKNGEFESVLIYFAYSLGSLFLTFIVGCLFGMFSMTESWISIEKKFLLPSFSIEFMALSILCSYATGALWKLKLENYVLKLFNATNKKTGTNEIFLDGSYLHKLFDDGKDHFIVVEKDGKEISAGFFCGASSADSERVEIWVCLHPELKKKFDTVRNVGPEHPINEIKGTYIDITNNIIIKELEYPLTWI